MGLNSSGSLDFKKVLFIVGMVVFFLSISIASQAAAIRGMITDQETDLPIEAVTVTAGTADDHLYKTRTDGFGLYTIDDIEPGTYTLETHHPGYHDLVNGPDLQVSAGERIQWHKALKPRENPHFDIYVEVACVKTGMKLANVPVKITSTPSANGIPENRSGKTDDTGFIQFTGLTTGFYTVSINEGSESIPGWESHTNAGETAIKELTGPHWIDVNLKPEKRDLMVNVVGYNPVTQEDNVPLEGIIVECDGVHPQDIDIPLLPTQVGATGIKKEEDPQWNNQMVGKVNFKGLPPIDYIIRSKRLGYMPAEGWVRVDGDAQLIPSDPTLYMVLQATELTVVVDTPYHDPEMLDGLDVRLQGLKNSNTDGIDRTETVKLMPVADANRAEVFFDNLLPGRYEISVADTVERHVPIIIEGEDINAGKQDAYSKFSVNLTALDYVEAVADKNQEITLFCEPELMTLTGRLLLDYQPDRIPEGRQVEIHASEYYRQFMPEAYHKIETRTNALGEFTVTLMPGLYGITLPELNDEYWGQMIYLFDLDGNDPNYPQYPFWPYYQVWPHSLASAKAFLMGSYQISGLGGVALPSGKRLLAELLVNKRIVPKVTISFGNDVFYNTAKEQVVAIDRSSSENSTKLPEFHTNSLYADIAQNGTYTLSGRSGAISDSIQVIARDLPPGVYTLSIDHPRLAHITQGLQGRNNAYQFRFGQYPGPGLVPAAPFPEDYYASDSISVSPGGSVSMRPKMEAKNWGTAEVTVYCWAQMGVDNEGKPIYGYRGQGVQVPQLIKMESAGDRVFYYGTNEENRRTPGEPYEMWLCVKCGVQPETERWYRFESSGGNLRETIYVGGVDPDIITPTAAPPDIFHDLYVEAVDDNDGEVISGVSVSWYNAKSSVSDRKKIAVTSGSWLRNATDPHIFYDIQADHADWIFSTHRLEPIQNSGSENLQYKLVIRMNRAMKLRGKILNRDTGQPVPHARISLLNNSGGPYGDMFYSGEDGTFEGPGHMEGNRTWFLQITATGFLPYRTRLAPGAGGTKEIAHLFEGGNAIELVPFERPDIAEDSLSMNRWGAFIPGAKKAGNQTAFNAFNADGPLTMTWRLDVGLEKETHEVTLPGFDTEKGKAGPNETVTFEDKIADVWLVDMKSFADNRYNDEAQPLTLEESSEPARVRDFLKKIVSGKEGYEKVFYQRLTDFETLSEAPLRVRVTGKIKLWELPPDLFDPSFIVVTKQGAVSVYDFEYTGSFAEKELTGARLPPWLASMVDIMGTVAGTQSMAGEGLMNVLPKGKFIALPEFTADVVLRASNALNYVYSIDTQVNEGMQSSVGGLLGLGPGFMGMKFYAGIEATLKGEDREFYVQVKGGVTDKSSDSSGKKTPILLAGDRMKTDDYKPNFATTLKKGGFDPKVDFKPKPSGEVYYYDSYTFDPENQPHEVVVQYGVSGQTGVEISASIVPVLKYIKPVGPILLLLKQSGGMDIRAFIDSIVGVRSMSGFKTTYPRQEEHGGYQDENGGSVIPGDPEEEGAVGQPRRHFLGGNEEGDPVNVPTKHETLDIAFGLGVGMDVQILQGKLGAKGSIELSGDDSWTGRPSMLFDVNPKGEWPILTRVRGDLRAVLTAYYKTWIAKFQKKWHWKAFEINHKLNTESVMHLIEMDIVTQRRDLGEYEPATFTGEKPVIVDEFLPLGLFNTAPGDGDLLVYTDMTSDGEMALMATRAGTAGTWGIPVKVSTTTGFVAEADIIYTAQGDWLAVWTEIARDDLEDFYPPSRIMYARGDADGAQWSEPAIGAEIDAVAAHLRLIPHGDTTAVVYTHTADGPVENNRDIYALVNTDQSWSAPQHLVSDGVTGLEAFGSSDLTQRPTMIAYKNDNDELYAMTWDTAVSQPYLVMASAGDAFGLAGREGLGYLAYTGQTPGIGLFQYNEQTGEWTDLGMMFPEAIPRELSIVATRENDRHTITIAWNQSDGKNTPLFLGVVDPYDPDIQRIRQVTDTETDGDFRSPVLQRSGGDDGLLLISIFEDPDSRHQLHGYRPQGSLDILYGDVNKDGVVDLEDVIIIQKMLIKLQQMDITGKSRADVTRTGRIDPADVIYILKTLENQ